MSKQDGRFSTVIRKGVRERFFAEPEKGKLVSDLLELHYDGPGLAMAHKFLLDRASEANADDNRQICNEEPKR